jgi:DNA repair exonuclease SbcCD ATPase subunit
MEGKRQGLESIIDNNRTEIEKLDEIVVDLDKCAKVFQYLIESKKEEVKRKIESLVTQGLQTIFERDDYRFTINMEVKRNVMTATPIVFSKFQGEDFGVDPMDGRGGGLCDVISFLLQIIVLLAFSSKFERILICDETFKHVSRQFLPNVAEFLTYLNEKTGIQMILVTHQNELADVAEKHFEVRLNSNGETIIKEMKHENSK